MDLPEDSGPIDDWQQPQAKDIDKASSKHVREVDKEDMPSLNCVVGMSETDSSGDETASERTGRGDQCDPSRNGEPSTDPRDPLLIRWEV